VWRTCSPETITTFLGKNNQDTSVQVSVLELLRLMYRGRIHFYLHKAANIFVFEKSVDGHTVLIIILFRDL